jgi:chaperone required for assembly of F1-ATPase
MADYALDVVTPQFAQTVTDLPYGETDTCATAEPTRLAAHQRLLWEPLVTMAEARLGVEFVRVCGIIHKPQSPATLAALRGELEALSPRAGRPPQHGLASRPR